MKKLLGIFAFLCTSLSHAGSASSGALSDFNYLNTGVVIVYTSGARTGVPSCAASQPSRFVIDATTAGGKVQLAGLLTAYTSGKPVVIVGTGACGVYGDTESISYFYTVG
jgi:hypothetical protein